MIILVKHTRQPAHLYESTVSSFANLGVTYHRISDKKKVATYKNCMHSIYFCIADYMYEV